MHIFPFQRVSINDAFWSPRLKLNSEIALDHQWKQLEKSGCIQNFRILADQAPGFRRGWFFADSDAYKWLDAAARVYQNNPSPALKQRMDLFINTLARAQTEDGYLYTYNQIHFPESRWQNLKIEHELYCHGHLIEAAVSHVEATGEDALLNVAVKAADLLVSTFQYADPAATPGHQEIEIALMRLFDITGESKYLDLAEHFLINRGRLLSGKFAWQLLLENMRVNNRTKKRDQLQQEFDQQNPQLAAQFALPAHNLAEKPRFMQARFMLSGLSGGYFQQDTPLQKSSTPVGHAVRFAYLETAAAMLVQRCGEQCLLPNLKNTWQHMIEKRMYVTGGTGSLPISEGFGRDYELDPKFAYAETCAALGDMFWNWEMTQLTNDAAYADLFERQLYNASLVGIGQKGDSYLYNNPLANHNGFQRQLWFEIPCCPSNISRTWAALGKYLYSYETNSITIHQYIGSQVNIPLETPVNISMRSKLPWQGKVTLDIDPAAAFEFTLFLRIPSWADGLELNLNGNPLPMLEPAPRVYPPTASGYDPRAAQYLPIRRIWQPGDQLEINIEMSIQLQYPHPKVKSCRGKTAISRGPLVFCLEQVDNPGVDLFSTVLDPISLSAEFDENLLGGITLLKGKSTTGDPLTFIPYAWWANRNPGPMMVYVGAGKREEKSN